MIDTVGVSSILRKLADMMDSGAVVSSEIHVTSADPILLKVHRIEEKDPVYVSAGPDGQLQRFSFSCDLTTDIATVRSVMKR